jgi:hypothetical protein
MSSMMPTVTNPVSAENAGAYLPKNFEGVVTIAKAEYQPATKGTNARVLLTTDQGLGSVYVTEFDGKESSTPYKWLVAHGELDPKAPNPDELEGLSVYIISGAKSIKNVFASDHKSEA